MASHDDLLSGLQYMGLHDLQGHIPESMLALKCGEKHCSSTIFLVHVGVFWLLCVNAHIRFFLERTQEAHC